MRSALKRREVVPAQFIRATMHGRCLIPTELLCL